MESEKKLLERLVERVDELLTVLSYVTKDLREVSEKLKGSVQATGQAAAQELTADKLASAFPDDLRGLLKFEDAGEFITIKPTGFLGSDNFAKIADIVRNRFNGEYVSAGKDSRFRVPKKQ